MEALNHPERRVKTIHVAGTNGKGSTVTYLRSMLEETKFFVGTYMSPVFGEIQEQISINGNPMPQEDFAEVLAEIQPRITEVEEELGEMISEFEVMTAVALYYFSFKKPVDLAIIETGMGGRQDATNVIRPLVSIITNVGMDHQAFLGESITEIAMEKAGIIKPGVPVMTAAKGEALEVIKGEANKLKSSFYLLGDKCTYSTTTKDHQQFLSYEALYRKLDNIQLGMVGKHQGENAALAIMTLDYLKQYLAVMVDDDEVTRGAQKASLPGRFEEMQKGIIFDTAHNPDSIKILLETMEERNEGQDVHVLFAAMKDKDIASMLELLRGSRIVKNINVTTFPSPRAFPLNGYESMEVTADNEIKDPVQWIQEKADVSLNETILVTGSHEFIGFIKNSVKK